MWDNSGDFSLAKNDPVYFSLAQNEPVNGHPLTQNALISKLDMLEEKNSRLSAEIIFLKDRLENKILKIRIIKIIFFIFKFIIFFFFWHYLFDSFIS